MTARLLLGTQGWNHPAWVGPFYPHGTKPGDFLSLYARAFPSVEVDSTFFSIPAAPVVSGWKEQTPPGFVFALKVPQEITHEKRLVDTGARLTRFVHRVSPLEDRLGPLLLQMSPDFRATADTRGTLRQFLAALPGGFRWAVEFRQAQWLTVEVMDLLREHQVALALDDGRWVKRGVLLDLAIEPTAGFTYLRWSGSQQKSADPERAGADRGREISAWARVIGSLAERVDSVFGYFHNQFAGHAPASARQLQQELGLTPVQPAMLREQAELF